MSKTQNLSKKQNGVAFLFLSPWIVGFLVLTLGPMLGSLYLSFTDYDLFNAPTWAGLENYARLGDDPRYLASLKVTLYYVLFSVPLKLGFALFIALILNRGLRGLGFYRSVFYLPSLLGGSVAVALMWRQIFSYDGIINQFLWGWFGYDAPSWITNPDYALGTLVLLAAWQFGAPMVIFLAGLKQIPQDMYDAAAIDGARPVQQFFYVTVPLLTPIIFFNFVMQTIGAFQAFTPSYIISDGTGGPADSTLFYTLYLYEQAFTNFEMGYASAIAWVLVAIIGLATTVSFLSAKYWVHYGDEG
ncbi:sugar ABC transporter permease [Marinovum sp.]|uniref:carbohydrate ABC transporter permease n=1 Tax=Marinovum sp. TaxID=2024839 RepID=UPI002B271290|nr:sugar ABC transporter permease [Marinovum sp.]